MAHTELNMGRRVSFYLQPDTKSDHCNRSSPTSNPPFDSESVGASNVSVCPRFFNGFLSQTLVDV